MRGFFYLLLLLSFIFAIDALTRKSKLGLNYRMASDQSKTAALKMNDEDVATEAPEEVPEDATEEVPEDATEEVPEDATDDEGDVPTADPDTPGGGSTLESQIHAVREELRKEVASLKSQLNSVKTGIMTCQVGEVFTGGVPGSGGSNHVSEKFPIKLTGFKNMPKIVVALSMLHLHTFPESGRGESYSGVQLKSGVTSPTSAYVYLRGLGYAGVYSVGVSYVACGN